MRKKDWNYLSLESWTRGLGGTGTRISKKVALLRNYWSLRNSEEETKELRVRTQKRMSLMRLVLGILRKPVSGMCCFANCRHLVKCCIRDSDRNQKCLLPPALCLPAAPPLAELSKNQLAKEKRWFAASQPQHYEAEHERVGLKLRH